LQKLISSEKYEENNFWSFCFVFFLLKKRGKILEPQFMAGNLIGLFPDWNKSATAARRINKGV
jgi:hypothetical protein